jgi:hypothetical protein
MEIAGLLQLTVRAEWKNYKKAKYKVIIRNHMSEGREVT